MFICTFMLANSKYCEANHIDSLILQDLKGVKVSIGISENVANLFEIETGKLKKRIEKRLEHSNIIVFYKETSEYYLSGRPTISINIQPLDCGDSNSTSFLVETTFRLTLRTFSNPKAIIRAPILQYQTYNYVGDIDDFSIIVDDHISKFVKAACKFRTSGICKN